MQISTILFDLDGTLTDPGEGIVRCLRYALETLGMAVPPESEMERFVGPPLRDNFAALCGGEDSELIERGVAHYRERYGRIGAYENRVYDGIVEMLESLGSSRSLYVATSKAQPFAEQVVQHFSLDRYFQGVHGSMFDARFDDKGVLVADLIAQRGLNPAETVMVGDRRFDIDAARSNGLRSIGVTYGYGSREELATAGADYICTTPAEVLALLDSY